MDYYVGFMFSAVLWFILIVHSPTACSANAEGDALYVFGRSLHDPQNVLNSWDPTLVHPCTWFHITCDNYSSVIRVDLGNSGLSGPLSPQLGTLLNLQELELYENNFSGSIPPEFGNITNLDTLDLYSNNLTGQIPHELGNCVDLTFLRLQNNSLSGRTPVEYFAKNIKHLAVFQLFPGNPGLCNPFTDRNCTSTNTTKN